VPRLDVIGAGNFARTMLLPHLRGRIPFGTVVNATALSANHVKTKFRFAEGSTDAEAILATADSETGFPAVLIATRHHLHARLVLAALARDEMSSSKNRSVWMARNFSRSIVPWQPGEARSRSDSTAASLRPAWS